MKGLDRTYLDEAIKTYTGYVKEIERFEKVWSVAVVNTWYRDVRDGLKELKTFIGDDHTRVLVKVHKGNPKSFPVIEFGPQKEACLPILRFKMLCRAGYISIYKAADADVIAGPGLDITTRNLETYNEIKAVKDFFKKDYKE